MVKVMVIVMVIMAIVVVVKVFASMVVKVFTSMVVIVVFAFMHLELQHFAYARQILGFICIYLSKFKKARCPIGNRIALTEANIRFT